MPLTDDFVPGAAVASLFILHTLMAQLALKNIIPRDELLEVLDGTLEAVERMQSNAQAANPPNTALLAAARAARLQIEGLYRGLEVLRQPPAAPGLG